MTNEAFQAIEPAALENVNGGNLVDTVRGYAQQAGQYAQQAWNQIKDWAGQIGRTPPTVPGPLGRTDGGQQPTAQ